MESLLISTPCFKVVDWKFLNETAQSISFSLPAPYEEKEAFLVAENNSNGNGYKFIYVQLVSNEKLPDDLIGKMEVFTNGALAETLPLTEFTHPTKNVQVKGSLDQHRTCTFSGWKTPDASFHIKLTLQSCVDSGPFDYCCAKPKLETAFNKNIGADFKIKASGKVLKVSSFVLMTHSPVFYAMIESELSESKEGMAEIDDIDFATMERLVKFIYQINIGKLDFDDACNLMVASNKYDIESLKGYCGNVITQQLNDENVFAAHQIADHCKAYNLILACVRFIAKYGDDRLVAYYKKKC